MNRLAFIVPYRFMPPQNGGHKAAYGFAKAIQDNKHPVIVISTDNNSTTKDFQLNTLFPDVVYKYIHPWIAWKVVRLLRKSNVTHLILHQPFMAIWIGIFCRFFRIQYGIFVQNIEYQRFKTLGKRWWPLMYLLEGIVFKRVDRLFFIAPTDLELASKAFPFIQNKSEVVPYGIDLVQMPDDRQSARVKVIERYSLNAKAKIFIFFGPQGYKPNHDAVIWIRDELYPKLSTSMEHPFEILICGGGLEAKEKEKFLELPGIHYLGFVEDLESVVKSADLMLNPILTGGGVKTKIIESIAMGTAVISMETGAIGVDEQVAGTQLVQTPDGDADAFVYAIVEKINSPNSSTSPSFYSTYNWKMAVLPVINWVGTGKK